MKIRLLLAVLCACAFAASDAALAPVSVKSGAPAVSGTDAITIPYLFSYQGKLTDTFGIPVMDTTHDVEFRLYTQPTGGTTWWSETQSVRTRGGLFSVLVGDVEPIEGVPDEGALYLTMTVHGGTELSPRIHLGSVPYAYKTERAGYADLLQGKDTTGFVRTGQANSVTSAMISNATIAAADLGQMGAATGQVMKWTGSAWAPRNDSVGSGGGVSDSVPGSFAVSTDLRVYGKGRFGQYCSNAGTAAFVAGSDNSASGNYSAAVGGADNTASQLYSFVGGGSENQAADTWAFVGGGNVNVAVGNYATVTGGNGNNVNGIQSFIGGGTGNQVNGFSSVIAGGEVNIVAANIGVIAGGSANVILAGGGSGFIGGGTSDTVAGTYAAVVAGLYNKASGTASFVGSGTTNKATGATSAIAGGTHNTASSTSSAVGGGQENTVSGDQAVIAGGALNQATGWYSAVTGGYENRASGYCSVAGGQSDTASGRYAGALSGFRNVAADTFAVVCGGDSNHVTGSTSFVGGGRGNTSGTFGAFVGAGLRNRADVRSAIAGGVGNSALGNAGFIGAGANNVIPAGTDFSVVGGGHYDSANASYATVGGGESNTASDYYATVGGGTGNTASARSATVPGGLGNAARGFASFAAGEHAKANHAGCFVWSDTTFLGGDSTYSTSANQFRVRARGGTWFFSNAGMTTGAYLASGSNSWASACDSANKEDFRAVDRKALLDKVAALRVRDYKMRDQNDGTRHIGPVAQDFHAAFGVGETEKGINMADMDGVTLAAIQALYEDNQQLRQELEALKAELKSR